MTFRAQTAALSNETITDRNIERVKGHLS